MPATITRPAPCPEARPPGRYRSDTMDFGPHVDTVPTARLRTRALLAEWGLAELGDDAEQVVAELLANAVETHQRERLDAPVRLTLLAGVRTVLIAVRDASAVVPVPRVPSLEDENGRGLFIVAALAAWWDTKSHPDGGKVIRALLRADPDK